MRTREDSARWRTASAWRWRVTTIVLGLATTLVGAGDLAAQNLEQYDYENLKLRAIGIEGVWVGAKDADGALGFGLRADLGPLGPNVRVVPRFAWWKADIDQEAVREFEKNLEDLCTPPGCNVVLGSMQRNYWVVGLDLEWVLESALLAPYLGAGGDLYILDDSGQAIEGTFLADAVVTAGISGVAGLQFDAGKHARFYMDVRATLVSSASNLALYGGLAYRF